MNNQHIIDAVTTATLEVFTTMLGANPEPADSYSERNASGAADGVVALIGLTGQWVGTGMVTCGPALATQLSAALLMSEPADGNQAVNEEVLDAMAEITNMIVGNVKNILEAEFGELNLSIPTVVYGKNLTTRSSNEGEWVVVPFACGADRLEVKICLMPNAGKSTHRASFSAALHA